MARCCRHVGWWSRYGERVGDAEVYTLPEINIALENRWLGDHFLFGMAYFQVLC